MQPVRSDFFLITAFIWKYPHKKGHHTRSFPVCSRATDRKRAGSSKFWQPLPGHLVNLTVSTREPVYPIGRLTHLFNEEPIYFTCHTKIETNAAN